MFTCCSRAVYFESFGADMISCKYTFVVTTHRNKLRKSTGLCCLPVAGSYRMIQLILFSDKACETMGKRKRNLSCLLPITPFAFHFAPVFPFSGQSKEKKKTPWPHSKADLCLFVCLFVWLFVVCCCCFMASPVNFKLFIPITLKLPKERLFVVPARLYSHTNAHYKCWYLLSFSFYLFSPLADTTFHPTLNSYKYKHSLLLHKYGNGHLL